MTMANWAATITTPMAADSGKRLIRTYFHYNDEGLAGEYTADGSEIKTYGYHHGSPWTTNPLFLRQNDTYYYYINDHLGTPQKIIAENGSTVWSARYTAFGKASVIVGNVVNNLRFPGQYYDAETGLHYNWNRYYSPETGRYITADPIGLAGGINLYSYVEGDPINLYDINGLEVTVCNFPGIIGHVGIGVPGTWDKTIGFRSRNHERKGPGKVSIDVYEVSPECKTIETTCEEEECIRNCIERSRRNPGAYHYTERNCVHFVRDCLSECGLPSGDAEPFRPSPWFESLEVER
jgi:RHS repeat-associated protein